MNGIDEEATPGERFLGERLDKATALLRRTLLYLPKAYHDCSELCPDCAVRREVEKFLGLSRPATSNDSKGDPKW